MVAYRDPLIELPQPRQGKLLLQFDLTDQYNLQELLFLRFEIRQDPDLFQDRKGQILRLIDDQDRVPIKRLLA